jgi:signal transduction histidine kinase
MTDQNRAELLTRLAAHRTVGKAPRAELQWLVDHGEVRHFQPGDLVSRKGEPVDGMHILLHGHLTHYRDQGGTVRKVMDWREGDVTGHLPYSRLDRAPGNTVIDEPTESLFIPREQLGALAVACPQVTAACVHIMVDRARAFTSSDLQFEKLASLGKLAAGLAHELNNPASAAARSAQLVTAALSEADAASRALGAVHLEPGEQAAIDRVRDLCFESGTMHVRSPLERSDREESIAQWLEAHEADAAQAAALAETAVTLDQLNELAGGLAGDKLRATLRWVAAACSVRGLARDIERAASRVHTLVSAVKSFTYMDKATVPEPIDLGKGLNDTLALLAAKARGKSAGVTLDVPADLPRVRGFGGELNQVWVNLIDNALDAVAENGRVTIAARQDGSKVIVRVTDNGPGIPAEVKDRIFDPFFTTKPVGKGTGLGLDIVRRLLERNEASIEVASQPGRTEFQVALPIATMTQA